MRACSGTGSPSADRSPCGGRTATAALTRGAAQSLLTRLPKRAPAPSTARSSARPSALEPGVCTARTRLMGLPVARTTFSVYLLSGALAGCAGVFLGSQNGSVDTAAGQGWELSAIAAVVVGGTLLTGGVGSVLSSLVGVL